MYYTSKGYGTVKILIKIPKCFKLERHFYKTFTINIFFSDEEFIKEMKVWVLLLKIGKD